MVVRLLFLVTVYGLIATTEGLHRNEGKVDGRKNYPISRSDCYHGDGSSYRGTHNTTKSGKLCIPWPFELGEFTEDQDIKEGHNYCRNPFGDEDMPVCVINIAKEKIEDCDIPKCRAATSMFLQRSVLLVTISLAFCFGFSQTSHAIL